MPRKIYVNGLGLGHPSGSLAELLSAFSGNVSAEAAPRLTFKELMPGVSLRRVPRSARLALEAASLALRDAWLPARFDDAAAPRAGVFTGSAHGSVEASFGFMDSVIDFGPKLSSPTAFSLSVNNVFTGMLSLYLNTRGPGYTSCQFGASFAGALAAATGSLLAEGCDVALVGAVEESAPLLEEVYRLGLDERMPGGEPSGSAGWEHPATECAAFFVLGLEKGPVGIELDIPAWAPGQESGIDLLFSIIPGGFLAERASRVLDCRALYGNGPAMQAMDMVLACSALRHGLLPAPAWCGGEVSPGAQQNAPQKAVCECFSALSGTYSAISLRKA